MFHNIRINCDLSLTDRPAGPQCSGRRANQPRCLCRPQLCSLENYKFKLPCSSFMCFSHFFMLSWPITFCIHVGKWIEHGTLVDRISVMPLLEVFKLEGGIFLNNSVLKSLDGPFFPEINLVWPRNLSIINIHGGMPTPNSFFVVWMWVALSALGNTAIDSKCLCSVRALSGSTAQIRLLNWRLTPVDGQGM